MLNIPFPEPEFKIETRQGRKAIFDNLRKKWLLLTPEEWVRQNFLAYLLKVQQYPSTLIALEKQIRVGELVKRFDILVYDSRHQPWMMVECKAPEVPLTEATLQQILRYHISTPAKYLFITNGKFTMGWEKADGRLLSLSTMPSWPESQ